MDLKNTFSDLAFLLPVFAFGLLFSEQKFFRHFARLCFALGFATIYQDLALAFMVVDEDVFQQGPLGLCLTDALVFQFPDTFFRWVRDFSLKKFFFCYGIHFLYELPSSHVQDGSFEPIGFSDSSGY